MKIKELTIGTAEDINVLIQNLEERNSPKAGTFLNVTICDGETQTTAKIWRTNKASFAGEVGKVNRVRMRADAYNGGISYTIQSCAVTDEDPSGYVRSAAGNVELMMDEIYTNPNLGRFESLVRTVIDENREKLMVWSAAKQIHHNVKGGLVYHVYRIMKAAEKMADIYPVDKELLVSAAILHDIGKLRELSYNDYLGTDYTPDGILLGHLFIGAEYIGKMCDRLGYSEKDKMLMQHMLASHHGHLDWGAISIPAIPEAFILFSLDNIDAKMYQFEEEYAKMVSGSLSEKIFGLDTRIYKA